MSQAITRFGEISRVIFVFVAFVAIPLSVCKNDTDEPRSPTTLEQSYIKIRCKQKAEVMRLKELTVVLR